MQTHGKSTSQFNANIHGLRGFAAFSVLVFHLYRGAITAGAGHIQGGLDFWPDDALHSLLVPAMNSLNAGIEIFFMISGFLITSTLIRHRKVGRFLLNRALRIYPVFLATQALMFTVGPIVGWSWMKSISPLEFTRNLIFNVLLLPGVFDLPMALPAAWTLSYEALFYLVAATIFWLSKRDRPTVVWITVLLAAAFVLHRYPRGLYFFVGTAVYFMLPKLKQTTGRGLKSIPLLPLASCTGLHYLLQLKLEKTNPYAYAAITPVGFVFFYYIVTGHGLVSRILRHRVFQFLGTISYSLYLWQVPVMFVVKRMLLKHIGTANSLITFYSFALVATAASIVFSYGSYRLLEDAVPRWIKHRTRGADATA
ncbi:acyltransferase [bacterium]|nr:acyltransferase [bacterium]